MPSCAQRSASQVPGEETLDRHTQAVTVGGNGLEKRFRSRLHIPVKYDLPVLIQDAEVHGASVQIDATRILVRLGVKSPEVSSSSLGCVPNVSSPTAVCRGGDLYKYQRRVIREWWSPRWGLQRRPQEKTFQRYPFGYFPIDMAEVRTQEGKRSLLVAIDRTGKFA
jgi:hypothetical protein